MNPEAKQLWVEALRSGKYKQTTGLLRRGDNYCCLGVLCEIAAQNDIIPAGIQRNTNSYNYDGNAYGLPTAVVSWARTNGVIRRGEKDARDLSTLNDAGISFEEIAQIIEEEF